MDDNTCALTELGQQQATITGETLATRLKGPINIYSSTMTRARQTTELILNNINNKDLHVQYDNAYREVGLGRTINNDDLSQFLVSKCIVYNYNLEVVKLVQFPQSIDQYEKARSAFRSLFLHNHSTTIYVCHKNIILYFIAR